MPWLLLFLYWVQFWNRLRLDWSALAQYAYGWCVPFLAIGLLYVRWRSRPAPQGLEGPVRKIVTAAIVVALALHIPISLVEEASVGWRALLWFREFWLLSRSFAAVTLIGGLPWARHFAFPFCFTAVAVPWPGVLESGLVQSLTQVSAFAAVEVLHLAGIPAVRHGNLIEVATGTVGVEEACSGVRGLQISLMISLMLGELDRLSVARRFVLVGAGALIAVLLNVTRAATLSALAATRGLGAVDQWHDMAGLLEWAAVLAGIMLASRLLRVKTTRLRQSEGEAIRAWPAGLRPVSASISAAALLTLLSAAGATAAWFGFHESSASVTPRWTIRKPAESSETLANFKSYSIPEETTNLLCAQEGWSYGWTDPHGLDLRVFFFSWPKAGNAYLYSSLTAHRPDTCMPASGFVLDGVVGDQEIFPHGIPISFRQYRFHSAEGPIYVFYSFWKYRQPEGTAPSLQNHLAATLAGQRPQERQMVQLFVTGTDDDSKAAASFKAAMEKLVVPQ